MADDWDFCRDMRCPSLFSRIGCLGPKLCAKAAEFSKAITFWMVDPDDDDVQHFVGMKPANNEPARYDMAYEVKICFEVTKDGNPFHKTDLAYSNLPYDYVVEFEKFGAKAVGELTSWGEKAGMQKK